MPIYYADPRPIFQPAMRLILSITQANPAVVTTTFPHQYLSGTVVRLDIPQACGMPQANTLTGAISVIDSTSFYIDINTTQFQAFAIPTFQPHVASNAMVIPIGEINETLKAATQNVLPFA